MAALKPVRLKDNNYCVSIPSVSKTVLSEANVKGKFSKIQAANSTVMAKEERGLGTGAIIEIIPTESTSDTAWTTSGWPESTAVEDTTPAESTNAQETTWVPSTTGETTPDESTSAQETTWVPSTTGINQETAAGTYASRSVPDTTGATSGATETIPTESTSGPDTAWTTSDWPESTQTADQAHSFAYFPQCEQDFQHGNCSGLDGHYHFDNTSRKCVLKEFSSCPGNDNYFRLKTDCQERCETDGEFPFNCSEPLRTGTCSPSYDRFYYNREYDTCVWFTYTGCDGNYNRFLSIQECELFCKDPRVVGYDCLSMKEEGRCKESISRWYHDRELGCVNFNYTGCGGNANRFETLQHCQKTCGVRYDSKCDRGLWGPKCENQCNCKNNSSCLPKTGECICKRGWRGKDCNEKCPEGVYGLECAQKCPPCRHGHGSCHHVTGRCPCKPGFTGMTCSEEAANSNVMAQEERGLGTGAIIGIFLAMLLLFIVVLLVIYYRKRVNRLKTELAHVTYIADPRPQPDRRHFDNPVYQVQGGKFPNGLNNANQNSLTSIKQIRNDIGPSNKNVERSKLGDDYEEKDNLTDKGACGGGGPMESYDFPKSKEVDCYNPNIYHDIEDLKADKNEHFYDEVKFKTLEDNGSETYYDHLEHNRPATETKPHYHKMTDTIPPKNKDHDKKEYEKI